ncbi:MAG: hypothetical protein ABI885_16405 [Gammaproteobacteria bacterium]
MKRIRKKHGYLLDKQEKAARTVLEHAELISRNVGGKLVGVRNPDMVEANDGLVLTTLS